MKAKNSDIDTAVKKFLLENGIPFQEYCPLSSKTWIRRGGDARFYIEPQNSDMLVSVCSFCIANGIKYKVLGHTSNVYLKSSYRPYLVISTRGCNHFSFEGNQIICECGAPVSAVAKEAVRLGLSGLEYITSLPGTIGGAVYNNSSSKSSSVSSLLSKAEIVDEYGKIEMLLQKDFHFRFRDSDLKSGSKKVTLVRVWLICQNANPEDLLQLSCQHDEFRRINLESGYQNLGCTVNRPFCLGKMPIKYFTPIGLATKSYDLFVKNPIKRTTFLRNVSTFFYGKPVLARYISPKSLLTFKWVDEKADLYFETYLAFMRDVFMTDKMEIEVFE